MKQLLIWTIAVLSFGAVSCQKANVEPLPDNGGDTGKQVEVMLNLSVAPTERAATKGADTQTFTSDALDVTYSNADEDGATTKSAYELTVEEESRFSGLWIVQFNKSNGKRNGTPIYVVNGSDVMQSGNELGMPIKLKAADAAQVIYVVANTGSSNLFSGASAPADEATLNKMVYSTGEYHQPSSSYGIPMLGRIEVSKVDATTTLLTGTLERLFAKVKLNLKNEFADFVVSYVQLKNAATGAYYRTAQTGAVNFPTSATGNHIDYQSEAFDKDTYVYYVPENLRTTTGTVNSAGERTLDKTDGKATYVEIAGVHDATTPVIYRLPLGDVATDIADFNVRRNRTYTLDVTLKGANTVDQRITALAQAAGAVAPANSFMVYPGTKVNFDARIRGNGGNVAETGLATAIAPASVVLLWQDAQGLITNANATTGVVPLSSGVATVQTKLGTNGNAVVAAYSGANGTGTILWSWHIWVTDYAPVGQASVAANTAYTVTGGQVHTYGTQYLAANPGKVIMDRNLGATYNGVITDAISYTDVSKISGQYYQWGRKDPLGRANGMITDDYFTLAPWYNAAGASFSAAPVGMGTVPPVSAVQEPMTCFILGLSDVNNPWGDGEAKTIFDPCPAGWRVPKIGTWGDFTSDGIPVNVVYPAAGERVSYYSTDMYNVGGGGYYSSAPNSSVLRIDGEIYEDYGTYYYGMWYSSALSVRCIQE